MLQYYLEMERQYLHSKLQLISNLYVKRLLFTLKKDRSVLKLKCKGEDEMTAHIESKKEEIAKRVLMPGDPLRAKYVADKFLTDAKCINQTRGMLGFTGKYKGVDVTIFASGMGGPSIGIYAYELYKFYDVGKIIRIGTCGSNKESVKVRDLVVADAAYTLSSYPKLFFNDTKQIFKGDIKLVDSLYKHAKDSAYNVQKGTVMTSDIFDVYVDKDTYFKNYDNSIDTLVSEMECAILYCMSEHLKKQAGCVLTVVDSIYEEAYLSSEEREKALDDMIKVALDTVIE